MRDDLTTYLIEVSIIPPLSPRMETHLFEELDLGGPQADHLRSRIVEAHLRLAVNVARKYQGRGLDLLELIEAANIGLLRAIDKYDYRKGIRFSTYAVWWMRKAIVADLQRRSLAGG
jgi:DNA-directed RNA polymerase sigma subunit (sigma70/sigma32)